MGIVTWKVLEQRIASGLGSGHGDNYQPWLWIRRKNPSRKGNQVFGSVPGYRRGSHFMAAVEWYTALLCRFLGAIDVREQLPIWPHPHRHTLADLNVPHAIPLIPSVGLWQIARDAGIKHGLEIGSDAPYVATLDLGVRVVENEKHRFAAISLKPHAQILEAEATDRLVERLRLEWLYCREANSHYAIVDECLFGEYLPGNLETMRSGARLPTRLGVKSLVDDFASLLDETARLISITEAIDVCARKMQFAVPDADLLWRHAVWNRLIDVDITRSIQMTAPLSGSGIPINNLLATQLFGQESISTI